VDSGSGALESRLIYGHHPIDYSILQTHSRVSDRVHFLPDRIPHKISPSDTVTGCRFQICDKPRPTSKNKYQSRICHEMDLKLGFAILRSTQWNHSSFTLQCYLNT